MTDQLEALARKLAEEEWPVDVYGQPASQRCFERLLPILREHFAERDEREQRLREAFDQAVTDIMAEIAESKHAHVKTQQVFWDGRTRGCELALIHLSPLRAALHPNHQEPSE